MGPLSPELAGMPVDVSDEVVHGRRLHPPDKGGQEIHIRGLGTKVVPELVFNTWAGMRRCRTNVAYVLWPQIEAYPMDNIGL